MPRYLVSRPTQPTPRIPTTAIAVLAAVALRLVHARAGSLQHAGCSPLGLEESTHAAISVSTESDFRSSAITGDAAWRHRSIHPQTRLLTRSSKP